MLEFMAVDATCLYALVDCNVKVCNVFRTINWNLFRIKLKLQLTVVTLKSSTSASALAALSSDDRGADRFQGLQLHHLPSASAPTLAPSPRLRSNGVLPSSVPFLLCLRRLRVTSAAALQLTMEEAAHIAHDKAVEELREREYPMLQGWFRAATTRVPC